MIRLKYKIAIPFVAIIIVVPLLTLLVFNIAIRSFMLAQSKQELKNTVESARYLLREGTGITAPDSGGEPIPALLDALTIALRASRLATDTQVLLFSGDYALAYPKSADSPGVPESVVAALQKKLPAMAQSEISVIKQGKQQYLALAHTAKQLPYIIVFLSSMNGANAMMRQINAILIVIMAVAALLSSLVAFGVSGSVSKPIYAICAFARRIGKSDFAPMPVSRSSQEICELCNSMNEMADSLGRYDRSQRTFLQNASHELRTPLMSIQGYAEGIMNGVFADNIAAAGVIDGESKRLTSLVEELLVLSRIENRTYAAAMQPFNLPDIIRDLVQRVGGLAIREHKKLEFSAADESIPVLADENLLSQAFVNVASNCLRHAKTRVRIEVLREKDRALVRISDDGGGIAGQDLPHLFERFYKGKGGNFGLGLSIAQSAAEYLKGGIEAGNGEVGAWFVLWLPLKA